MPQNSQLHFVQQQGFRDTPAAICGFQYAALMWQPRVITFVVAMGVIFQTAPLFLVLSAILWWNVVLPQWNVFDAMYNRLVASPPVRPRLTPAPAPRRFSQALAGSFMLAIGISLVMGWSTAAYLFEGLLMAALAALIFGRFCLGSYLFHLITGESSFANRTLPWS